jgi:hypothetical protein
LVGQQQAKTTTHVSLSELPVFRPLNNHINGVLLNMKSTQGFERRHKLCLSLSSSLAIVFALALTGDSRVSIGGSSASAASSGGAQERAISPAAVPNDTCATATLISPAALPFAANDTTDGATNDIDPGLLGCASGAGPDAVYSFTPSATDRYTIGATPIGIGFDISLYVVTDCANPATTCIASANVSGTSKGESTVPTLNAGTRYFIVVDGSGPNSFGQFHFSIRRGLPANDTCASPGLIEASRLPFTVSATTFGAVNDLNPGVPCLTSQQSGNGADVVYQFTPADTQNYILTVTPTGEYDTSIYIVTNCASLTGCTSADFGGAGVAETLRRNLTAGTTYFIVVDGFGGDAGDFTLSFEPSIPLAPNPPTVLVATIVSSTEIRLDWVDNSSNELGFRIERSLDGFAFSEIATVASNVTTFSDTTVFANTTFFYRVFAFNNFGNSPPSNLAAATTPPPPPPPAPVITVSPNPLDFGSVRTTLTRTLTISNVGGTNLVISAISNPAAPFSIVDRPTLPLSIAPAASIELMVRFTPTGAQAFAGSFTIESNDTASPFVVVNLSGIGAAAPVPNLDFPSAIITFPSGTASIAVEIKNTGDADLVIASLSVPAAPFSFSGNPAFPAVFRPGEGFVLTIAFSPAAPGVYSADMLLVSNDPDQLLTVFRLRGTSTPQDELFKLKAPSTAVAIAGQSNTFGVLAANGTNTDIRLSATTVQGGVFTDRGNGRGDLVLTPAASATGRLLVTFNARDGQNRQKSVQSSITILAAADSHRAQVIWTPPASGTNPPSSVLANDLSITPLALGGDSIDLLEIEPQQTTGLVGYVIYRSTTPGVPVSLTNIVGTAIAGQSSFVDNLPVPASSTQTFSYVVTALYGTGTDSATSNETSTAPRMISLDFKKKGLRMQAANSNIAVGAVAIVDGTETYVLTRSGDRIVVEKNALSTPGGLKPAKLIKTGSTHTVRVRNPNGVLSAVQSVSR